jgi:hypothetical protein
MNVNEQEEILRKATEHMIKSLNCFGQDETLKLLVRFSNGDVILRELLAIFPSIVTMNHFLYRKPIIKIQMNEEAIEYILDTNLPFLVREQIGSEKDRNIHKKASRKSKKKEVEIGRFDENPKWLHPTQDQSGD